MSAEGREYTDEELQQCKGDPELVGGLPAGGCRRAAGYGKGHHQLEAKSTGQRSQVKGAWRTAWHEVVPGSNVRHAAGAQLLQAWHSDHHHGKCAALLHRHAIQMLVLRCLHVNCRSASPKRSMASALKT